MNAQTIIFNSLETAVCYLVTGFAFITLLHILIYALIMQFSKLYVVLLVLPIQVPLFN